MPESHHPSLFRRLGAIVGVTAAVLTAAWGVSAAWAQTPEPTPSTPSSPSAPASPAPGGSTAPDDPNCPNMGPRDGTNSTTPSSYTPAVAFRHGGQRGQLTGFRH